MTSATSLYTTAGSTPVTILPTTKVDKGAIINVVNTGGIPCEFSIDGFANPIPIPAGPSAFPIALELGNVSPQIRRSTASTSEASGVYAVISGRTTT